MAPDTKHLWNRGQPGSPKQTWFLRLPIPHQLRRRPPFSLDGKEKPAIIRSLETGDLAVAQRKRDELTVTCRRIFDDLLAGRRQWTAEQIEAEISDAINPPPFTIFWPPDQMPPEILKEQERHRAWWQRKHAADPSPPPSQMTDPWIAALRQRDEALRQRDEALRQRAHPATIPAATIEPTEGGETISQALDAWLADPRTKRRAMTEKEHRARAGRFIEAIGGDIPLTSVTRAMVSNFLTGLRAANGTRNNYCSTLSAIFESAKLRGSFTGDNPVEGQRAEKDSKKGESFTVSELQKLFDAMPRTLKPAKHTPESALPWVSLIAAYSGACLEEITQLKVGDIRDEGANGATITVLDIHNGGSNQLKNESGRPRLVPLHSALVRAGLLDYVKTLPKNGLLFPGLVRRASKGDKIGTRVSELFRKKLVALGIKREGLNFHSFRHTATTAMREKESDSNIAYVLGHTPQTQTGKYGERPSLKRLAAIVEEIRYPGLKVRKAVR